MSWAEQEISSCPWKWGELPDFPGQTWAQHLPVEMSSCFLFPLCLDHISNMPNSAFALWWGWRHQTHADERLKDNNGAGKWMLRTFLPIFPKKHLAATLRDFPVLCKLLAPAVPGLCWDLRVQRSLDPLPKPGSQPLIKARSCLQWHQSQMWIIDGIRSSLKNNQNPLSLSDDQLPENPSYLNHREHMGFWAIIWACVLKSLYGIDRHL